MKYSRKNYKVIDGEFNVLRQFNSYAKASIFLHTFGNNNWKIL